MKVSDDDDQDATTTRNKSQYTRSPESRDVRHILVKTKALADQLYAQLQDGAELRGAREEVLDGPGSQAQGGKLHAPQGPDGRAVRQGRVRAQRRTDLEAGHTTQFGWHIIQALADKAATPRSRRRSRR